MCPVFWLVIEGQLQKAPEFCQEIILHSFLSYSASSNPLWLSVSPCTYCCWLLVTLSGNPLHVQHLTTTIFSPGVTKHWWYHWSKSQKKLTWLESSRKAFNFIPLVQLQKWWKSTTYVDIFYITWRCSGIGTISTFLSLTTLLASKTNAELC